MTEWIKRAAERIVKAITLEQRTEEIALASHIIAAEHSRDLCERLNKLPMYGNDWGDIADAVGLSVDPLNGFVPRETT